MTVRPTIDSVLLHCAYAIAVRGTCPNLQVGAVIAREGRILSTGYNGVPTDMPHCAHSRRVHGEPIVKCGAIHAEINAVAFAARYGTAIDGGTMYCTDTPCQTCAQLMIQSGLRRLVAGREYRDDTGVNLLARANIEVIILTDGVMEVEDG